MEQTCFRILLPLTQDELAIGQRFMQIIQDSDILESQSETIKQGSTSYQYLLNQSLPDEIQFIIKNQSLQIEILKEVRFSKIRTQFKIQNNEHMQIRIDTNVMNGSAWLLNPHQEIDIIQDFIPFFQDFKKQINQAIQENFPLKREQWNVSRTITVQQDILIDLGFVQNDLKQIILGSIKNHLIYYYKSMLIMYNKWKNMSIKDLEIMEQEIQEKLSIKNRFYEMQFIFKQTILNEKDLFEKTNFIQLHKKDITQEYELLKNMKQQNYNQNTKTIQNNQIDQQNQLLNTNQYLKSDQIFIKDSQTVETPQNYINKLNQNIHQEDNSTFRKQSALEQFEKIAYVRKTGNIFKKGQGPLDFGWNQRYLVLNKNILSYYDNVSDKNPKGIIIVQSIFDGLKPIFFNFLSFQFLQGQLNVNQCQISTIYKLDDQEHAFSIQQSNPEEQIFHFAADCFEEAENWRNLIYKVCLKKFIDKHIYVNDNILIQFYCFSSTLFT